MAGPWEQFQSADQGPWSNFAPITPKPSTERTTGEAFKDIGASVVGGFGSLLQVPGQLAQLVPGLQGVGQALAKPGELLEEKGEALKSQGLKVREALRSQAISEAEKEGILSSFATAITETVKDPALLSTFITGQLPQLLGPAAAAKVGKAVVMSRSGLEGAELAAQAGKIGTRSAIGAGAVMQGADISADTYKQAFEAAQKQGMSAEDANAAALTAARKAFALAAPISVASQYLPGGSAIERRLAGVAGKGRIKGALGEAVSEGIEEGGGAFATNVGVLGVDPTRELTQGVGSAAGLGTLGGGVLGGVLGKATAPELPPELRPGETDRQAAERIQAEIMEMKQAAQPPVAPPSPVLDTNKLYNLMAQPNGYGLVEQYKQRLAQLPETPETKAAIDEASFIQRRAVIEEIGRQPTKAVLDDKKLKNIGFKPNDGVYELLLGKDIANPDEIEAVTQSLQAAKAQENISPTIVEKIDNFLIDLSNLQESIYPKGPPDVRKAVAAPSGEGVPVAGEPGAGVAAEGVAAPVPGGVVPAVEDVGQPAGREGQKPASVEQNEKDKLLNSIAFLNFQNTQANYPSITGLTEDGKISFAGDFRRTPREAKTLLNTYEAALKLGATPQEIFDASQSRLKPAQPEATAKAEIVAPLVAPPAPAPAPPVAAPAVTPVQPAAPITAEAPAAELTPAEVAQQVADLKAQQTKLLTKAGKVPAPRSPARQKYDALSAQIADLEGKQLNVITRKPRKPPSTIMGSPMLAGIFNKIGGLHSSLLSEFSTRFFTKSLDKKGRPVIRTRNPLVSGYGTLFNKNGKVDFGEIAEHLEQEGYLEPGSIERDYKDAGERAKDLIKRALNQEEVLPIQERVDRDAKELEASERQRTLDRQEENRMIASGELQLEPEFELDNKEFAESLGLGREFETDLEMYNLEPKDLEFLSDAELESDLTDAERDQAQARRTQKAEADAARAAPEGVAPGEAEEILTRPTAEGLKAKQEAAEKAAAEEKKTKAQEQERLRKEQLGKEEKARADESAKDFELGKSAEEQMTGMGDLFGKKSLADIPATRWGEIERKAKAARETAEKAEATPEQTELNKEIEAKIDELGRVLSRIMGRFGLKNVALKLVEDMKAEGEYAQSVVRLALDAASPVQALRHESIHALKELGFFSPQQWSALEKQAKSKWIDQYLKNVNVNKEPLGEGEKSRYDAYMDLYKGDMDAIIEEAIADAFGDFDVNKAPPGMMQAILNRLRQFFDGVKTVFGGEITAEQVFRKAERGELKAEAAPAPEGEVKPSLRAPQTEAFKKWFGNSKVVDESGDPLVVYHGTASDFTEFRRTRSGEFGPAIYTTDSAREAGEYGVGQQQPGVNIMPVYVSIKNPYNKSVDEFWQEFGRDDGDAAAVARAQAAGYDGVISKRPDVYYDSVTRKFVDRGNTLTHYIAFSPSQIKSATGNIGAFDITKPDIRYSLRSTIPTATRQRIVQTTVTRDEKTFYQRIIEAISPSSFASFRADALNRYNQLSVYDKKLAEKMGGKALLADSSAESAALFSDLGAGLTASALGVDDRMGGIPVYRNGITIISNMNGTVKGPTAIFAPLAKQPGDYQAYQYWAGVKRGSRFLADGREQLFEAGDIQKAEALRKQYLKDGIDFNAIQKEWTKFNDGLVDYMVATGVLSKERADLYKKHSDYLPFYRQMNGEETVGPKIFQSIAGVKPPKKLKGSEAPLDDFLENIVRNTQASIQAGIKNIASQRAAKVAVGIQMADRLDYHSTAPNVFHVYENGKPISYLSQDKLFIDAIKSLGLPDLPFIGLFAGPANLLRALVTKDPGFMLANLMRDSMSAWVTSGVKMTPMVDTIKNFGSAVAGKSPEFQALMNAGILGGYEFSQNVEQSGREFGAALRKQAKVKQPGMKGVLEFGAKPFTSLWDALEKGSTASDAATRMEIYKKTLAKTGNEAEALYRSLEVMNFNRKGSSAVVRVLTAAVPFLNARMQGLDVLYRASTGKMNVADAKQVQRNFFVRGATIAALSTFYWALTHDDDEYKKQEQETRDNYWLLPSMGVKIPIPFEIGVLFKVIPERILGYTMGSDTGEDFLKSMARQLTSTLAFNPIPQTVLPVVESMTNFSFFTMRPIVGQGLEGLQPAYQVGPGTSRIAETIGGATKSLPKELQISPAKLDQMISGYTGTMGMYMVNLMDAIYDMNTDSPKPSRRFEQMPLIRRFAIDPEARGSVTAYYDLKNSVDSVVRTSNMLERTMNYEELPGYLQDNSRMLASKDYILDLEKTLKEFREMKIMIRSAKMSAEAKGDAISSIEKMENQLTSNIQYIKKIAKG
jgi:hypothetical protein